MNNSNKKQDKIYFCDYYPDENHTEVNKYLKEVISNT